MIRVLLTISFALASPVLLAAPLCTTGACNVSAVQSSVFLQTGHPGYVLYQQPQVSYSGGPVGQTYQQTESAQLKEELAVMKAMIRAIAEKGLADGTVNAKAFAELSQPMVNKYCVGCHRVADPNVGKGFPLTDIASLMPEQRLRIIALVMSEDPAEQMPKPGSQQRKEWNADDAGKLLKEVSSIKSRPAVPVE